MASSKLLVVAMDFGTTYSGYAFSLASDFKSDPLRIFANTVWNAGGGNLMSLKTPTVLFVDPKDKNYFGYEAQNKYMEIAERQGAEGLNKIFYFSLFKMKLHGEEAFKSDLQLEDESGRRMLALDVFSLSIGLLKDHMFECLDKIGLMVNECEVTWVLTVPAIWSDPAKLFMRKAAEKAGIPGDCLKIALEPEAASLFCQNLPVEKLVDGSGKRFSVSQPGTKYIVVDLGGGTVDITVHEKLGGDQLKELVKASGGAYGGSVVNSELFSFWTKIVGGPTMKEFQSKFKEDYINMYREFEVTKRGVDPASDTKTTLKIPAALNEVCKEKNGETIGEILDASNSPFKAEIERVSDKLRVSKKRMLNMFRPAIDGVLRLLDDIMKKPETRGVGLMLLVGGFADCTLVQNAIREKFPKMRIVIPQEAGLVVLRGAVLFGHSPHSVLSRVTRYTYGVKSSIQFDPKKHDPNKKIVSFGKEGCEDTFSPFMLEGENVKIGQTVEKVYTTLTPFQGSVCLPVYTSHNCVPTYVTDTRCKEIGELSLTIPFPTEDEQSVEVAYYFGDTEVKMTAKVLKSGKPCTTSFKLE